MDTSDMTMMRDDEDLQQIKDQIARLKMKKKEMMENPSQKENGMMMKNDEDDSMKMAMKKEKKSRKETEKSIKDLLTELSNEGFDFTQLSEYVKIAGLSEAVLSKLEDPSETLTLFAPTNAAFDNFTSKYNKSSKALGPLPIEYLRNTILGHLSPMKVDTRTSMMMTVPTERILSNGKKGVLCIASERMDSKINGVANIVGSRASKNTVVYVIDKVLLDIEKC